MFKDPKTAQKLAFYGVFYILFALIMWLGWTFRDYIRPIAALIFPINDKPPLYNFLVLTGMYWGTVFLTEVVFKKKN